MLFQKMWSVLCFVLVNSLFVQYGRTFDGIYIEQYSRMSEPKIIQEKIKQANGQTKVKRYLMGNFLGKGGFAQCYQATEIQSKTEVAIKIINKDNLIKSRAKQKLLSEIKIHRALNHKYIVKFLSVFEDENNVFIVLELCTGRSISDMVKKRKYLTCEQTRYYLLQLISALQYLHANKVIHRDLKMANIFLSEKMEVKLGDFGLSAKLQFCEERKRTMAGTPNYIAPQIIDGSAGHSYEVDLWSTGIICYALLFGRPPFQTSQLKMTYSRIKNCEYNFPTTIQVPSTAKDFIKKTLVVDPKKRMTISEMYEHPFLKGERPISIPRYATDEAPVFKKQDFVSQDTQTTSSNIFGNGNQSKIQLPRNTFNNLTNTSQFNRPQDLKSNADNLRSPANLQKQQRNSSVGQKDSNLKSNPAVGREKGKNLGVFVVGHVDYSTKYGMGYFLSNGCMGVYFNDSTIMASSESNKTYYYLDNPAHSDAWISYSEAQLPGDHNFTKKKMLLSKFQTHLRQETTPARLHSDDGEHIFVKQWLKTKHAIMFRLNNKIFQVNFFDHSQILLRTDSKEIKFKNKKGEEQYLLLSDALNDKQRETELGRRIKYTKQILNSLKKDQAENNINEGKKQ